MTNTNRHIFVASLTALFSLAAFADETNVQNTTQEYYGTSAQSQPSSGVGYSAQGYREPSAQTSDPNLYSQSFNEERSSANWNDQASMNSEPYYRSSSASINSGTHNRLQDPTNPRGSYDTDKSGYANRWNSENRNTIAATDYQRTPGYGDSSFSATTTRSSAESISDSSLQPSVNDNQDKDKLTAIDRADLEKSRQIRRELTSDKSLSVYGKNVKIETKDGVATLSGPVKSETEKDKVESVAEKIVGTAKVRNELEIKH